MTTVAVGRWFVPAGTYVMTVRAAEAATGKPVAAAIHFEDNFFAAPYDHEYATTVPAAKWPSRLAQGVPLTLVLAAGAVHDTDGYVYDMAFPNCPKGRRIVSFTLQSAAGGVGAPAAMEIAMGTTGTLDLRITVS